MTLVIRQAVPGEEDLILRFIRDLADYEKLHHEVVADRDRIRDTFFAPAPRVFCDVAEWNGEPAGAAIWFYNYSTFHARHGIYLEDLFVEPAHRGKRIGKALLENLARRCMDEKLTRLQWWVLDWNSPAIEFYRSLGARPMDEWMVFRLSGSALQDLAR
ncbi:MAG: GNAT family N-acetyltransferase [Hyphomicrobiales bacterium]